MNWWQALGAALMFFVMMKMFVGLPTVDKYGDQQANLFVIVVGVLLTLFILVI